MNLFHTRAENPPLAAFGPQLGPPLIAEQTHEQLGNDLADALLPLTVYCTRQEARQDLSEWQADHVATIRATLAALDTYDAQVEELLALYRQRLATARQQLTAQVLPLEMALVQAGPDWRAIGFRLLARLYRYEPGVVLACQRLAMQPPAPGRPALNWEAVAFRLLERLHRHEPPPPPSPFVQRVRALLDGAQARAGRPPAERHALAAITSHSLTPHSPCAPTNAND